MNPHVFLLIKSILETIWSQAITADIPKILEQPTQFSEMNSIRTNLTVILASSSVI